MSSTTGRRGSSESIGGGGKSRRGSGGSYGDLGEGEVITPQRLELLNVEQSTAENLNRLEEIGGVEELALGLGVDLKRGPDAARVEILRDKFGDNFFPETPIIPYSELLLDALSDSTLIILILAAAVSLVIGVITEPDTGWIEGAAIFFAVFLVSTIAAGNDYSKQLQFKALEDSASKDERCSVYREECVQRIPTYELVVGDVVILQAGDQIPADCVLIDNITIMSNEASLTGEAEDLKKDKEHDPFLLSSCLVIETQGDECRALVIGVGRSSQWGKIKGNLITESVNTPLQDKLEEMTKQIGYLGMISAFGTFVALIISIWARDGGNPQGGIAKAVVDAFIISVTIVVVAIPEGLPLAVTISLAYSTKKMYTDNCFIRVLAACETMGNATNICSDKTGTLTENKMTVVCGWFGNEFFDREAFLDIECVSEKLKRVLVEHISCNRTAYLINVNAQGERLEVPNIVGNKTEGALIMMMRSWGLDYEEIKYITMDETKDRVWPFNSLKKRSSALIHRSDGSVRLFVKGASEVILKDCSMYTDEQGVVRPMTFEMFQYLEQLIGSLADGALRTLVLAHVDFTLASDLPEDWEENPPDNKALCCDAVVGIIDPLRGDVKESVAIAKSAGVMVRMVTGDNLQTAMAIARDCGILTDSGISIEGPVFRKLAPKELDFILPRLQVMARSSPEDKMLLVTRLNGHLVPENKAEWEKRFKDKPEVFWDTHRDKLLPGYREEWEATRPEGGQVVGVTGDGTNDAPALKAADVGLAMGITGTKVAQGAADIVILDDQFSSIVRAMMWGRAVYDNIRKFLQFQLTVNLVALLLVFFGAVCGFGEPLNAVQMLWVNLVMDTLGALALGTEPPNDELLERRPYKRQAGLISMPMWRNILCQSFFQLGLLLVLLFAGANLFDVRSIHLNACFVYNLSGDSTTAWTSSTLTKSSTSTPGVDLTCKSFRNYCPNLDDACYQAAHTSPTDGTTSFHFNQLPDFSSSCLTCAVKDYTHGTIIFNAFMWCQIFNQYTARKIFNELNMFQDVLRNGMFVLISAFNIGMQVFLVEVGGDYVKTSPLNLSQWLITIALGALSIPVGVLMRFVPPTYENEESFFTNELPLDSEGGIIQPGKGTIETRLLSIESFKKKNSLLSTSGKENWGRQKTKYDSSADENESSDKNINKKNGGSSQPVVVVEGEGEKGSINV